MNNILIIMSDQHSARWYGAGGNAVVQTPNLDRLAAQGVCFENAYCNSPLCVPSRMSFLTGRHVQNIGIWDNHTILPSSTPTWMQALRDRGYDVVLSGKMHFCGPDQLHGFRRQLARDIAAKPDVSTHGSTPVPRWRDGGRVPGHSLPSLPAAVGTSRATTADDAAVDAAVDYIRQADSRRPWALVLGIFAPHRPWTAEPEFWDLYDAADIPLPRLIEGYPAALHPTDQRHRALHQQPEFDAAAIRHARHGYFACVSRTDMLVGKVMAALDASGQRENTLAAYTSDHGEMLGEHGLWMKSSVHEAAARVPLILSQPKTLPAGTRPGRCVSLVDLTATILRQAGAADQHQLDGKDLLTGSTDEAFCEHYATWVDRPLAMLRQGDHKLISSLDEPDQLFNVAADPLELRDLSQDPASKEVLARLRARLDELWPAAQLNETVLQSQRARTT